MKKSYLRNYFFLTEMLVVIAILAIFFTALTTFFNANMKLCTNTSKQVFANQQIYILKCEFRKFLIGSQVEKLRIIDNNRTLTCGTKMVQCKNGKIVYINNNAILRSYDLPKNIDITFAVEEDLKKFAVMNIILHTAPEKYKNHAKQIRIVAIAEGQNEK